MGWKLVLAIGTVIVGAWMVSVSGVSLVRAQESQVQIESRGRARNTAAVDDNRAATSIHVNSDLVLIPVMVTDKQDRLIVGLAREQFRLWDDKVEQVISHFAAEDAPVSIGIVFDSSGSMRYQMDQSRAAVNQFVKIANPEDEFSLVEFNNRARTVAEFTSRPQEIQERLLTIEPGGRTALLDAMILSLDQMRHAKHRRKAILILSDGGDNNSRYSASEVKARLREADVQVYSISIVGSRLNRRTLEEIGGEALLDEMAKQTGGRLFEVEELSDLPGIASNIGDALRRQYVLGYAPPANMRDGKYHRVQVKVNRIKGLPSLRASFRSGYYASAN